MTIHESSSETVIGERHTSIAIKAACDFVAIRELETGDPWASLRRHFFPRDVDVRSEVRRLIITEETSGDPWGVFRVRRWASRLPDLLAQIRAAGVTIWVSRSRVWCRDRDRLDADLNAAFQGHLAGLYKLLERERAELVALRVRQLVAAIPAATVQTPFRYEYVGPICIADVVERWGRCMCCGEAIEDHRGGQCEICNEALPLALRQVREAQT